MGSGPAEGIESGRSRLLCIVGQLGYGGSERQLALLLPRLARGEWEATVLVLNPSPNADYREHLEAAGVRVVTMSGATRGVMRRSVSILRLMRTLRPHVVHSWTAHDNPYAGLLGRLGRVPVRWGSLRGSVRLQGFGDLPRVARSLALRSVQRVVVNSSALVGELLAEGMPGHRVVHLPNCVETAAEVVPADLSPLGFAPHHRVVGWVGNIRRAKNPLLFVRAMAHLMDGMPDVRGVIVGEVLDGEHGLAADLRSEIESRGLTGRLVLAGFRGDVPRLLKALAVLCLTSDSEGTPNVVMEAMAAGVPVVASRVGGVPDLVHEGETGLLFEPGDARGCAGALGRLLEQPDLGGAMAASARRLACQSHSCDRIARELGELYLEALKGRRTGRDGVR